jgi:transcriptional regulator with XRE-family HTH domain
MLEIHSNKRGMLVKTKGRIFIGDVIKKWRVKKNMTQLELSLKSGLDRSYLNELERTYCRPSLLTILKLAKGLGICPGTLIIDIQNEHKLDPSFEELAE